MVVAAVTPILLGFLALWAGSAQANDSREEALSAEVERVRAQVADEIQLYAYDLIDELVYQWIQEPVFDRPTDVVLAGVSVPVGLGTGMQALVENHLNAVLLENPATQVTLVHCPSCTAVVVHSGPEATTVTRGVDSPATLQTLGTTGRHALFIDVEAEGAFLVLRARITRLTPELSLIHI